MFDKKIRLTKPDCSLLKNSVTNYILLIDWTLFYYIYVQFDVVYSFCILQYLNYDTKLMFFSPKRVQYIASQTNKHEWDAHRQTELAEHASKYKSWLSKQFERVNARSNTTVQSQASTECKLQWKSQQLSAFKKWSIGRSLVTEYIHLNKEFSFKYLNLKGILTSWQKSKPKLVWPEHLWDCPSKKSFSLII